MQWGISFTIPIISPKRFLKRQKALKMQMDRRKEKRRSQVFAILILAIREGNLTGAEYEKAYRDEAIGVNVIPIFIETGEPGK